MAAAGQSGPSAGVCLEHVVTGTCSYGRYCSFNHRQATGASARFAGPHAALALEPDAARPRCVQELVLGWCSYGPQCQYTHKTHKTQVSFVESAFCSEMVRLREATDPTDEDEMERELVREAVLDFISAKNRNCRGAQLYLFGSSANGFVTRNSDIDMFIYLDVPSSPAKRQRFIRDLVNDLGRKMRAASSFARDVKWIATSKVPLIKFTHADTGIAVDLSVCNPLALQNTRLQRYYSKIDERVRTLLFTLKHWAKSRQIKDASRCTLSSYALTLMLLFYLQRGVTPPVLPCLQAMPGGSLKALASTSSLTAVLDDGHADEADEAEGEAEASDGCDERDDDVRAAAQDSAPDSAPARESPARDLPADSAAASSAPGAPGAAAGPAAPITYDDDWKRDATRDPSLPHVYIHGYECYFCDSLEVVRAAFDASANKQSETQLLRGFFEYYASTFDSANEVVCIRRARGHVLSKAEKKWATPLAVEDPFEITHNLTAMVTGEYWDVVRHELVRAATFMRRACDEADPAATLAALCEPVPERAFVYKRDGVAVEAPEREREPRSNRARNNANNSGGGRRGGRNGAGGRGNNGPAKLARLSDMLKGAAPKKGGGHQAGGRQQPAPLVPVLSPGDPTPAGAAASERKKRR